MNLQHRKWLALSEACEYTGRSCRDAQAQGLPLQGDEPAVAVEVVE